MRHDRQQLRARRGEHGQQTAAEEEAMMQKVANQSRNDGVTGKGFGEFPGTFSPTGWTIPEGLTFEEWIGRGKGLSVFEGAVQWWLGDWWVSKQP